MTNDTTGHRRGPSTGATLLMPLAAAAAFLTITAFSQTAVAETEADLSGVTADTPDEIGAAPFEYEELEALRDVTPRFGRRITVCAGQSLPGWAIYNVSTDFTACGGGWDSKWHLIELNGASPGQTAVVCTRSAIPPGWVVTGYSTNFTMCGRNAGRNNLKTIRFP